MGIGERYATEVGALWTSLAATLAELDDLAADPLALDTGDIDTLRRLQYRVHCASENAAALDPPAGVEEAHTELANALAAARDATADVVEALEEDGGDGAVPYVYEWRGALFRVRLARLRFSPRRTAEAAAGGRRREIRAPLVATLLVFAGIATFTGGAVADWWPLWAAGLLAVCASFMAYKP